ncbi:MAG: hypothetical protein ACKVQU_25155, partial [Burkholderiales bacterium]
IASTSWLSSEDFMAGRLAFTAPARAADGTCPWSKCEGGSIVNRGAISARDQGLVALVAPHVRNDGVIWAKLGKVSLGSGSTFTLDINGDGLLGIALRPQDVADLRDVEGKRVVALIENTGTINAPGGQVFITTPAVAREAIDNVINLGGVIRADTAEQNARGTIELRAANGRINIAGEIATLAMEAGRLGGTIAIRAPSTSLTEKALLTAGGVGGGGTITIQGIDGKPATQVVIEKDASLNVSASGAGNGGRVSVAGDSVEFAGSVSARGGASGGDGGQVDLVADKLNLSGGAVDAFATAGQSGGFVARQNKGDVRIDDRAATSLSRTLRSGTRVSLSTADLVRIESRIDGRGDKAKGGLEIKAGEIQIAHDIYTNDGRITLQSAKGAVQMIQPASGTLEGTRVNPVVFAESADIVIDAQKDAIAQHLITKGNVTVTSRDGNVELKQRLGSDLVGTYQLKSLTVRALGTPVDDANVLKIGNVSYMRDVAVAPGVDPLSGFIDIQVTRNIRLVEGPATSANTRAGIIAARDGVGGRSLRMQSDRLGRSAAADGSERLGDLTGDTYYWTGINSRIGYAGADKNIARVDGRYVDLGAIPSSDRDPGNPTITPPSPLSVLANNVSLARIVEVRPSDGPRNPGEIDVPPVLAAEPAVPAGNGGETTGVTVARLDESVADGLPRPPQFASVEAARLTESSVGDEANEGDVDRKYSGGRGLAQIADVGRGRSHNTRGDVFRAKEHVVELTDCASPVVIGNAYLTTTVFGLPLMKGCH